MASDSLIPSVRRPVPLKARVDLEHKQTRYQDDSYWIVKDPVSLKYFRLRPEQHAVLQLLDGARNIEAIRAELTIQFPALRSTVSQIQRLVIDLYQKGLVWSTRPGQGDSLLRRGKQVKWRRFRGAVLNPLFIKLPGVDPHRFVQYLYGSFRWLFHPLTVTFATFMIFTVWVAAALNFGEIQRRLPIAEELFTWQNLLLVWIVIGACKVLHELGHALACRHFGGECHEIGLAFLVLSPCLYCDVSDSWMLPSKWKRIFVAAAGMYIEAIVSAVSFICWWMTEPGYLNHLFLAIFVVTHVSTIVFNLNPLLKLDGYYILSDLIEIPNIRQKSSHLFFREFAKWLLGIRIPADPFLPQRGRLWFVTYAIASAIYRAVLLVLICFILYRILKPFGLQQVGLMMGYYCALLAMIGIVLPLVRLLRSHRHEIKKRRAAISLCTALAATVAILAVPLPIHVSAPLTIEPHGVKHVYSTTPGRLVSVIVRPGQYVTRGQVLAKLSNADKLERFHTLHTALAVQESEARVQQNLGDADGYSMAKETLRAIRKELDDHHRQLNRLDVIAPCSGQVVPVTSKNQKPVHFGRRALPSWHGTPLDQENRGCFLRAGEPIASIAPNRRFRAEVLINQIDRNEVSKDDPVTISFDHLPGQTFRGHVEQIAHSKSDNRNPGAVGYQWTKSENTDTYRAVISIETDSGHMVYGMRGHARILTARRSLGFWIWTRIRSTFNFHL